MAPTVSLSSLSAPSPEPSYDSEPPRKRARSDLSSEERKEARAHRNRIAAQNSRDRRKAQFGFLERRVNELEEENRQLHISLGLLSQGQQPPVIPVAAPVSVVPVAEDLARDRENAELKERIRTLERGWDAVVKALAAQGLPTGLAPASTPAVPPAASFPSPAPSHSSLELESSVPTTPSTVIQQQPTFVPTSSTSPSPSSSTRTLSLPAVTSSNEQQEQDSTRHLAAGGLASPSFTLNDSMGNGSSSVVDEDEQAMEELFREILVPVPSGSETMVSKEEVSKEETSSARPDKEVITVPVQGKGNSTELMKMDISTDDSVDWANEIEMQRLLDSLQQHSAAIATGTQDFSGLGLFSWNEVEGVEGLTSNGVDVF